MTKELNNSSKNKGQKQDNDNRFFFFFCSETPFYGQQEQKQTRSSEIFSLPIPNLKPTLGDLAFTRQINLARSNLTEELIMIFPNKNGG